MRTRRGALDVSSRSRGPRHVGLLAGIVVLLLAQSGNAKIAVDGDQAFKDQVAAALVRIADADPAGKALIDARSSSQNTITIVKTVKPDSYTIVTDFRLARNKTGIGSTVHWNPAANVPLSLGCNSDATAELFHELVHASRADKGTSNPAPVKGPTARSTETR